MDLPLESLELTLIKKLLKKHELLTKNYLEVGCGDGLNLECFSKLGMRGEGLDLSPDAVRLARAKNLPGVTINQGDFLETTKKDSGLILMLNVLEHVADDLAFFRQASSLLPAGGYLIIAIPANSKAFRFADRNAGHLRRYDRQELKSKLAEAGFAIEEWLDVGFPTNRFYTWLFNWLKRNQAVTKSDLDQTLASGIRHHEAYYGGIFDALAKIAFPILKIIIQIDRLFVHTKLGNNFIVLARKSTS